MHKEKQYWQYRLEIQTNLGLEVIFARVAGISLQLGFCRLVSVSVYTLKAKFSYSFIIGKPLKCVVLFWFSYKLY